VVAENLIYFEDLALSLGKDKKSFFHGVHIKKFQNRSVYWVYFFLFFVQIGLPERIGETKKSQKRTV